MAAAPKLNAGLSISPFVGVTLVLLIFALIGGQPRSDALPLFIGSCHCLPERPVFVTLLADGRARMGTQAGGPTFRAAAMGIELKARVEPAPDHVYILAEDGVRYEHLTSAVADLRRHGFRRVGLISEAVVY